MSSGKKSLTRDQILDSDLPDGLQVIRRFQRAVEAGQWPDCKDLEKLAGMFAEVERAKDAQEVKKAMKLETGRGRKPKTGKQADQETWIAVQVLRTRDRLERRDLLQGESPLGKAIQLVAQELSEIEKISEKTVRRYYDENREFAKALLRIMDGPALSLKREIRSWRSRIKDKK